MKTVLLCMALSFITLPTAAAPQTNDGAITEVIVYHGQALVTRTIELPEADGDMELLVENLPEKILPQSLYAVSHDGIQVLSVRYRVKEIAKDMRAEVRAVQEQIEAAEKELFACKRDIQLCGAQSGRFGKMWELSLEGANVSLDRGAFSSENMKDFTSYLEDKQRAWHQEAVTLQQQQKDLEKHLAELRQKKAELAGQHNRQIRQALIYLHVPEPAASQTVQLSYLVNEADWSPQYNLKADPDQHRVRIEYLAVVHQASGEDWTDASLALSTAVPALVASPPKLEPFKIGLIGPQAVYSAAVSRQPAEAPEPRQQAFAFTDQSQKFDELVQSRRQNIAKGIQAQQELNTIAISNQMIEFEADRRMVQQLKQQAVAVRRTEGVSVMYSLPGRLSLPSRSDQQLVTIASLQSPAKFVFVAAPLLTDYVYLQAEITNDSDTILLPGPADMFRNGQFVGNNAMTLVTIGQTFKTGFGVDSQIQVTREFKDKKIETLWGNRMDEQMYRLAVDNYYDKPVDLRLMDRLPWTESPELSIELTSNSHPLSTDAEYLRTERDKGILRWDLQLAPNTFGEKATIVNYAFTLKYDNDMTIRTMP